MIPGVQPVAPLQPAPYILSDPVALWDAGDPTDTMRDWSTAYSGYSIRQAFGFTTDRRSFRFTFLNSMPVKRASFDFNDAAMVDGYASSHTTKRPTEITFNHQPGFAMGAYPAIVVSDWIPFRAITPPGYPIADVSLVVVADLGNGGRLYGGIFSSPPAVRMFYHANTMSYAQANPDPSRSWSYQDQFVGMLTKIEVR